MKKISIFDSIKKLKFSNNLEEQLINSGFTKINQITNKSPAQIQNKAPEINDEMLTEMLIKLDKYGFRCYGVDKFSYPKINDYIKVYYKNANRKRKVKKAAKNVGKVIGAIIVIAGAVFVAEKASENDLISFTDDEGKLKASINKDNVKKLADNVGDAVSESLKKANRVPYQKGKDDNNIGFCFSCPGQKEAENGAPCQGVTGKNLNIILQTLNEKAPSVFKYNNKENYLITNSSDIPHYKKLTNDTEASLSELMNPDNLKRIKEETKGLDTILCFGENAKKTIQAARPDAKVISVEHPSTRNLNSKYPNTMFDSNLTAQERNIQRNKLLAEEILKQL